MNELINAEETEIKVMEEKKDTEEIFELHEKIAESLKDTAQRNRNYNTWNIILNHLRKKSVGIFYDDGNLYFFRKRDKRLMKIDSEQEDTSRLINTEFGIIPSDQIFDKMVKNIRSMTYEFEPKKTNLKRSAYYCKKRNSVYLSIENGKVLKITEDEVKNVQNGYDDVVFYANPEYFINDFEYDESINIDYIINNALDGNYKETETYKSEDAKRLANTWLLSFFMPEMSKTRMIMVAYGEHGSFKTTFTNKLGWILKGDKFNVTSHDDKTDMDTITTNKTFVAFDNLETKATTQFLDQLARIATGSKISKRKLYTTNDVLEFETQVNVCISAMTPTFRRPDVVERLLLVEMEKRDNEGYISFSELRDDFLSNRDKYMSCMVNQIRYVLKQIRMENNKGYRSKIRMAELGLLLKYREGEEKANRLLNSLKEKQMEYAEEFITLPDIIQSYLDTKCMSNNNEIKGMSATELYKVLKTEASNMLYPFKISSARALGKELGKDIYQKRFKIEKERKLDAIYYSIKKA
jgi:hypothetical protein